MEAFRNNHAAMPKLRPQPKQQSRRRQSDEGKTKEDPGEMAEGKTPKRPRGAKEQEPQPTPRQVADMRRASDKEGFSQVFRKRARETQGVDTDGTQSQRGTEDRPEQSSLRVEP
eukprot:15107863-Heterocapsa_arctica.AAC.1